MEDRHGPLLSLQCRGATDGACISEPCIGGTIEFVVWWVRMGGNYFRNQGWDAAQG